MVDLETRPKIQERVPRWLKIVVILSGVLVLLATSFYIVLAALNLGVPPNEQLPDMGDMATLLFGAASLALFIFSILIAIVGIVGYQTIRNGVRSDIEFATSERIETLEKELRGRVLSVIGFMIGALRSNPTQLEQDGDTKEFLSDAVWYCQQGYDILNDSKAKGRLMALNNLVYYSALYGEDLKPGGLLDQARELKKIGRQFENPPAYLTYCRVVLQFSSDPEELRDAHSVATVTLRMDLTERQRKEAKFYLAELANKLWATLDGEN